MSAVAADGLVVRFGALTAVDDVSLEIERGEVFGLLGPNGAGKTTTLRVLTTLLPADAGVASVAGYDVRADGAVRARVDRLRAAGALGRRRADRAREPRLLRARDQRAAAERAERIAAAVEAMELEPMLDRLARTFSGGMLRRLEIATALLNRPDVLFLDEPTVGLDPTARALVWERVHALRARGGHDGGGDDAPDGGGRAPLRPAGDHGRRRGSSSTARRTSCWPRTARAHRGGLPRRDRPRDRAKRGGTAMSAPSAASPAASAERRARPRWPAGPLRRLLAGAAAMSLDRVAQAAPRPARPGHALGAAAAVAVRVRDRDEPAALDPDAGGIEYRAYLAPGVMAQAAMFVAIFFGLAVIWERDVGQLQRLLATPLPRTALVLGKAAGAATRALVQAVVLLVVVAIAGHRPALARLARPGALVLLAVGTGAFACLSMTIASLVKERERFMGIGQLIMMPLFFASSALYPLAMMPGWLHVVARVNPLTYEVEGLRGFLLGGGHPGLDLLVCVGLAGRARRRGDARLPQGDPLTAFAPLLPSRAVCRRRPSWSARAATRRRRSSPPPA